METRVAIVPREDNANGARGKRGSGAVPLTEEAARLYLLYTEHEYGLLDSDYVFDSLWGGERGRPPKVMQLGRLAGEGEGEVPVIALALEAGGRAPWEAVEGSSTAAAERAALPFLLASRPGQAYGHAHRAFRAAKWAQQHTEAMG